MGKNTSIGIFRKVLFLKVNYSAHGNNAIMTQNLTSKKTASILTILVAVFLFIFTGCKDKGYDPIPEEKELSEKNFLQRGEYLVNSIGCMDCHSPKKMGEKGPEVIAELHLSGYPSNRELPKIDTANLKNGWMLMNQDLTAAVGPWGVSFASNITSDDTGIGNWSLEQFKISLTKGKFKGLENGRDLLPPMPWQNFANLTNEDLKAIYTYLQSTKPVKNVVPAPIPPAEIANLEL